MRKIRTSGLKRGRDAFVPPYSTVPARGDFRCGRAKRSLATKVVLSRALNFAWPSCGRPELAPAFWSLGPLCFVLVSDFRKDAGQQASPCGGVVDIRISDLGAPALWFAPWRCCVSLSTCPFPWPAGAATWRVLPVASRAATPRESSDGQTPQTTQPPRGHTPAPPPPRCRSVQDGSSAC